MKKKLARALSTVLNPFITFTALPFLLVYKVSGNLTEAIRWTLLTIIFLGLVGYFVYDQVRRGKFSDLDVSKREQRKTLFVFLGFVVFLYLVAVYLFHGPPVIFFAILGTFIGLVLIGLINTRVKASGHMAVLTTVVLTIILLYGKDFLWTLLLLPILAWSRVVLKRHTTQETITGFSLGLFLVLLLYGIAKLFFAHYL